MALVNQPPILASSFAVNGDKNTIPTTNSGTEGLASLSLGFPPITQQPVSQGGIPPQRADFNGIFNLITNFLMFIQNGSIFAYSSTLDYQPPAIVYGNNALYRCIATNGANTSAGVQPLSNTSYWQPLIPVGGITISGNTITVTNETGAQTQYTIDTINNPPAQSDSSNKIVTSAWVKAYAPSKTGVGASGTWGINVSGNASNATNLVSSNQYSITYGGGDTGVDSAIGENKANLIIGSWQSVGFRDLNGNKTTVAINNRTGDIRTVGNITADNAIYSATPGTSDNSTRVATTAFVKSLFTASKTTNGWWKEASTGMIWQWGEWEINSIEASASTNVTFPISFPNKCLFVIPSVYNAAEDQIGYLNVTQTGCSFKKGINDNSIGRNGLYLVIGC